MEAEYDASSIKILSEEECAAKWDWLMLGKLQEQYKEVPLSCITMGLEACDLVGVDFQYYIDKYLRKLDLPKNPELIEVYQELMRAARGHPSQSSKTAP